MQAFALIKPSALSLKKQPINQSDLEPRLMRLQLTVLSHHIQLIIRRRPKRIMELLEFYQSFLSLKENLEHYFIREQALLRGQRRQEPAPSPGAIGKASFPGPEATLNQLQTELAGFVHLLRHFSLRLQLRKCYGLAWQLFLKEVAGFARMLEAYQEQLQRVFSLVPDLPAGGGPQPQTGSAINVRL
jgi:hypothetical protein